MQHSLPCLRASSDILHNFPPCDQHSFIPHGSLGAEGLSPAAAGCWHAAGDPTPGDILFCGEQQRKARTTKHHRRRNVLSLNLMQGKGKTVEASARKGSSNVHQNSSTRVSHVPVPSSCCFPRRGCDPRDHSSSPNRVARLRLTNPLRRIEHGRQASSPRAAAQCCTAVLHSCAAPVPSWHLSLGTGKDPLRKSSQELG